MRPPDGVTPSRFAAFAFAAWYAARRDRWLRRTHLTADPRSWPTGCPGRSRTGPPAHRGGGGGAVERDVVEQDLLACVAQPQRQREWVGAGLGLGRGRGVGEILRRNLAVYGVGGVIAPFIGIKAIDLAVNGLGLV